MQSSHSTGPLSLSLLLIHPANPVEGKGISFTVTRPGSTPGDESRAVFCVSCFYIIS